MENQARYGRRISESRGQKHDFAIEMLQEVLWNTKRDLEEAINNMKEEKDGHPEVYRSIAESHSKKIMELEAAIAKLEKPHNITRSL